MLVLYLALQIIEGFKRANVLLVHMGDGLIVFTHPPLDTKLLVDDDVMGVSSLYSY